jgi:ABC-2 type transport system ATP-binding protein
MIKLTNLTKRYGSFTAVDGIDLEVPRGQLFGFLGPNGAGKTTTLRMIAGILRPSSGKVEIGGIDVVANPVAAKSMRQKLIIASAFVHRPEVIVVDEPMVGLDPKAARILKDLFKEYTRRGHTIMMSTHTLEVAEAMCDRIGIIQGGVIRACGTMDDLRAHAESGMDGLEQIFLRLTGENAARALVDVLDA